MYHYHPRISTTVKIIQKVWSSIFFFPVSLLVQFWTFSRNAYASAVEGLAICIKVVYLFFRETCSPVIRKSCEPTQVEECQFVPKEVTDRKCSPSSERICSNVEKLVPRTVCSPVERQVCKPMTKKECETRTVQNCKKVCEKISPIN